MFLSKIPIDLERAWSHHTLYPESVLVQNTTAYRTAIKSLKRRLDESQKSLFVVNESEVEVCFRDFVGNDGNGKFHMVWSAVIRA
jgi:hypothetical protein